MTKLKPEEVEDLDLAEEPEEEIKFGSLMPDGTSDIDIFTRENQGLVYYFVLHSSYRRVVLSGKVDAALELQDIVQEAFLGFLTAISKYDPKKGTKFSTYAAYWIRQRIGCALENSGTIRIPAHVWRSIGRYIKTEVLIKHKTGRWPSSEEVQHALIVPDHIFKGLKVAMDYYRNRVMTVYNTVEGGETEENMRMGSCTSRKNSLRTENISEEIEDALIARLTLERVLSKVTLREVEKDILNRRFGLDGRKPQTLQEVGEALGVTRERIHQREVVVLKKLRDPRIWEACEPIQQR